MAGGLTKLAADSRIRIIRKVDGEETVLERVSMHDLVKPEDVLIVPESFF